MKKITLMFLIFYSITFFGQVELTSSLDEYFDGTQWINNGKNEYKYNDTKNLIDQRYYSWDSTTSTWQFNSKETYEYNDVNKIISNTYESFDYSTSTTNYGYKGLFSYNNNNQVVQSIDQELDKDVWVNNLKSVYTYSNNKISEIIEQSWNGSTWVYVVAAEKQDASVKTIVSYNANGFISQLIYYEWENGSWSLSGKDEYTYTANNKLLLELSQDWNGSDYETTYKEEYSYDANGNLILDKQTGYKDGALEFTDETSYTFDTAQMMNSFTHPFKDKFGFEALTGQNNKFINKLIGSSSSDEYKTTYNYGEATASVKDVSLLDFAVYPNPTSSFLSVNDDGFDLKNIKIFNVLGKKVLTSTKNKINIESLVKGIYLLRIETEKGNIATKRIIKN